MKLVEGTSVKSEAGMTLRQAALVAGVSSFAPLLLGGVPFAEFYVFAKLIVPGDAAETVTNIQANRGLFLVGVFAHLITFVADVIIAWALHVLLAPVHRALSMLAAWFRLIYTAVALGSLMHLVTAFRLIDGGNYSEAFGTELLHAQVQALIWSFRYEWSLSLVIFGIHLVLAGYLVARSGYIPRVMGALLSLAGLSHVILQLRPYFYAALDLQILFAMAFGELIFAVWLLVRGWRISPNQHE